jgi:FkbM family methyltransferase
MHHEIFNKFECWRGEVDAGITPDFLGVKTRDSFFTFFAPPHPEKRFVSTEYPGFTEEYFEWIDLLEAVTTARGRFTMIELGAGYGRWLVDAVAALRRVNDIPYQLIGVEPEPTHFEWMNVHFQDNGVDMSRCQAIQAAVVDKDGWVWFFVGRSAEWYGQAIAPQPAWRPDWFPRWIRRLGAKFFNEGIVWGERVKTIKAVSLNTLLRPLDQVDLIDLDVQGAELIVLKAAPEQLNRKVRRVHIGTHGPEIEQGLRTLFRDLGWKNLNDYPCNSESSTPWGTIKFQDGVQSWINPMIAQ